MSEETIIKDAIINVDNTETKYDTTNEKNILNEKDKDVNDIKMTRIIFALPGDNFSSKFLISWTSTISKIMEMRKYDILISPATGSFVSFVRMKTLGLDTLRGETQKPFNNQDFDIWITIDSDIIFTPEQVIELIESTEHHPVVAGMYRMSDLINYAFVKDWDINHFKENGTFKFSTPEEIEVWKKETSFKYYPVAYTGMGFMAIKKEVFDKMQYPYFDSEINVIVADDGKIIRDICSEDVAFSKNIINTYNSIFSLNNNKFNISISKSHINKVIRDQNITLKQTRLRHEPVSRFKQPVTQ